MEAATQQAQSTEDQKLKIDKFSDGSITCLKFIGTIDEQFDGKKAAATLKGGTLVLDLAEIQRISSFGIREWVDFVQKVGEVVDEIYLIECAPKVVDQLNMVANFAGKGRVFSFYAPYRCDYCDADHRVLLQFDQDHEAIKGMKPPERPCENCGNAEYFDEDPSSFFSYLAAQPKFELEPDLANFLASKLNYAVSDSARRLRAEKFVENRSTYLKIAGDLDGSFPREKLAEGMEGTVVVDVASLGKIDPAGAAEWRSFLEMMRPTTDQTLLLGCPPVFVERLTRPEDLGPKAFVLSFVMPYSCAKCATTASHLIDVEEHFDVLKFATPPEMKCPDCGGSTACTATESLLSCLTALTKPTVSKETREFIKLVQERKPEREKIATTMAEAAARGARASWITMLVSLAGAAAIAAGVVFGISYRNEQKAKVAVESRDRVGKLKTSSEKVRPGWITGDKRFSASCAEDKGDLICLGVSSYATTADEARAESSDAALEEMVQAVAGKIDEKLFNENVRKVYADARQRALSEFDSVSKDRDAAKYDRARRLVAEGRKNVAAAFKKSARDLAPADPVAEYSEEYEALVGGGSKFLVFMQYRLSADSVRKLVAVYSTPEEALNSKALTVFPEIAWRYPDVSEGAVLVELPPNSPLRQMGMGERYIVRSVRDRAVRDATDYSDKIDEEWTNLKRVGGSLQFVIKPGDGADMEFNRPVEAIPAPVLQQTIKIRHPSGGGGGGGAPPPVNIWRNTGGGNSGGGSRDNPND